MQFLLEPLDLFARFGQQAGEPVTAAEAGGLGMRTHPHAVLGDAVELHQSAIEQRRHAARELGIEPGGMRGAKVGQALVIDPDAPAQPAVGIVALAQPVDLAGRAHAIDRRVQPQAH